MQTAATDMHHPGETGTTQINYNFMYIFNLQLQFQKEFLPASIVSHPFQPVNSGPDIANWSQGLYSGGI